MHDNRENLERRIERTLVERILPAQYAKLTPIHLDHYRLPLVAPEGTLPVRQGRFSHGKGAFVCDKGGFRMGRGRSYATRGVFAWEVGVRMRQGGFSHGEVSDLEQVGYKDKVLAKKIYIAIFVSSFNDGKYCCSRPAYERYHSSHGLYPWK